MRLADWLPGGAGDIVCLVHDGNVYAAYLQFGEDLSDPSWHHDDGALLEPTLTVAEQKRCDQLHQTLQAAQTAPDAGTIVLDSSFGATTLVAPACTN